jgi:hypothetical protein
MKTIKTTAGLAALTILALPAGTTVAKKPEDQPRAKSERQCSKTVGFSLRGTGLDASALTIADGKADGTLALDVLKANRHARRFLEITTLPSSDEQLKLTADAVKLRLVRVADLASVQPTDRVRIQGKVIKPRKRCATTAPNLDVRRITIVRPKPEQAKAASNGRPESGADRPGQGKPAATGKASAPGQVCRNESRKKTNHGKGKSPFAACVVGVKRAEREAAAKSQSKSHTAPAKLCKDQSHKKDGNDRKSPFAACVSGAAKAQNDD